MGGSPPWYFENRLTLNRTGAVTNLVVTIRVARTAGITFNGYWDNNGGFTKTTANQATGTPITFTWTRAASLPAGNTLFVAQTNGNGTAHPVSGDTWTVTYNVGSQAFTLSGTF